VRRMRSALLVLALVACGSKKPPPAQAQDLDEAPNTKQNGPHEKQAEPRPQPCLGSYAASTGDCTGRTECTFPEGTCSCEPEPRCSGKVLSHEQQAEWDSHLSWQCTPTPAAVRDDGCPGPEPGTHQACTPEGKVCAYPGCISETYTCTQGLWVRKQGEPPP